MISVKDKLLSQETLQKIGMWNFEKKEENQLLTYL